jgi:O-antigen ligase
MFLASYLSPALLYWIVRLRRAAANDLRIIQWFFVAFGVYLAFTAVCESHGLTALIYPRYILQTRLHYQGRAVGPLLSAPALGTWITVASVSLLLLGLRMKGMARAALFGILPVFAYAQYLTETRSAWLGYIIAMPLAALLAARSAMRHVLFVGFTLIGMIGGLLVGDRFLFPERQEGSMLVAHSTYQRVALLQRSLAMFVQRPILGWGFGQFEYAATVHGGGGPLQIVLSESGEELASHNLFLRFLAELGLVGCALQMLFFALWAGLIRNTLKTADMDSPQRSLAILFAAALCAYVSEAMFHDVTFIAQDNMLIFFLAGCLGMPRREPNRLQPILRREPRRLTFPDRLAPLTIGSPRFS